MYRVLYNRSEIISDPAWEMGLNSPPPALRPAYPARPPAIRLGEPWVVGGVALELILIFAASFFFWLSRTKSAALKVPDSIETAGTSCGTSRPHVRALLVWRICNLIWFSAFFALEVERNVARAEVSAAPWLATSYTSWCFYLQPWYWLVAVTSSLMHLSSPIPPHSLRWPGESPPSAASSRCETGCGRVLRASPTLSTKVRYCIRMVQWAMLETVLPSSWVVMLVVFVMLDPFQMHIAWNHMAPMHFWNAVALSVEFFTNRILIRKGHFVLVIGWTGCYVVYAWLMKATTWDTFVYWFMDLETGFALIWYPLIAAIHLMIYVVLVALSQWKEQQLDRKGGCCARLYHAGLLEVEAQDNVACMNSLEHLPFA